jgi:hypothetical protein
MVLVAGDWGLGAGDWGLGTGDLEILHLLLCFAVTWCLFPSSVGLFLVVLVMRLVGRRGGCSHSIKSAELLCLIGIWGWG